MRIALNFTIQKLLVICLLPALYDMMVGKLANDSPQMFYDKIHFVGTIIFIGCAILIAAQREKKTKD